MLPKDTVKRIQMKKKKYMSLKLIYNVAFNFI